MRTRRQKGGSIVTRQGVRYLRHPNAVSTFLRNNSNNADYNTNPLMWGVGKLTGMDSWGDLANSMDEYPIDDMSVLDHAGRYALGAFNLASSLPMLSVGTKTVAKPAQIILSKNPKVIANALKPNVKYSLREGSVPQEIAEGLVSPIVNEHTVNQVPQEPKKTKRKPSVPIKPAKSTPVIDDMQYQRFQKGGRVAKTKEDYELGILKGIDTFKFTKPSYQKMTMNTPAGTVPFPLEYKGYTKGKLTDRGIAKPGQDFQVYGDTIIEKPIFYR